MKTKNRPLISHNQLAHRADVNWYRVLQLVALGNIAPAQRVGTRLFFTDADVDVVHNAFHAPAEVSR